MNCIYASFYSDVLLVDWEFELPGHGEEADDAAFLVRRPRQMVSVRPDERATGWIAVGRVGSVIIRFPEVPDHFI
eukprot:12184635-Karenia_brevis.AAC.1